MAEKKSFFGSSATYGDDSTYQPPAFGEDPEDHGAQGKPAGGITGLSTKMFSGSAHPVACFFHVAFKVLAVLTYITCTLIIDHFVINFVLVMCLLLCDFWTVKNVSGRLLVGLRWWNELAEDGTSTWKFESAENRRVNSKDASVFWIGMVAALLIWVMLGFLALIKMNLSWFLIVFIAIFLNGANLFGYIKCKKDASSQINQMFRARATQFAGTAVQYAIEKKGIFGAANDSSSSNNNNSSSNTGFGQDNAFGSATV